MVAFSFNAHGVPPAEAGLAIWEGPVPVIIRNSEVQETAAKNGNKMLIIHVDAMDGQYKGQSNVIRLNLWNNNPQASEIAQRQLSSICHVTNRMQLQDTSQLNGAMFLAVYAKEDRQVKDQTTGVEKTVESCQAKDFRFLDGRSIKEAMAGQPAASPYNAGAAPQQPQSPPQAPQPQPGTYPQAPGGQSPGGFAPPPGQPAAPPSFAPPGGPGGLPGGLPGTFAPPPPGQPQGGFAPPPGPPPAAPGFAPQMSPGYPQQAGYQPQGGYQQPPGLPGWQQGMPQQG